MVTIYKMSWVVTALAAVLLFVTGNLGPIAVVSLGFLLFTLVFMGMISVLPSLTTHAKPQPAPMLKPARTSLAANTKARVQAVRKSLSSEVEIREPHFD